MDAAARRQRKRAVGSRPAYAADVAHDFDADRQALIDSAIESHLRSLSPEQLQALGELDQEQLNERMESAISASVEGAAGLLAEALKERAPQMLEDRARIRAEFEASLERQWAEAFALSQMVIVAARETRVPQLRRVFGHAGA
jgi:hypothetical protein